MLLDRQRFVAAVSLNILASLPHSAMASPDSCARINNDLDRLACYDKHHGRTPQRVTLPSPSEGWSIHEEISKITDQKTVIVTVRSNEIVNCGWNRGAHIHLVLRCMESKTVLYFNTGCHMTSSTYNSYGNITYRIDDTPAQTVAGSSSTDSKALGLWSGSGAIPLIKKMFGRKSIVVRMTPYGESPFVATFNIVGIEQATQPLRKSCNW